MRRFLLDAYNEDGKWTTEQKQYIASLIREVEAVSEERYRISPWFEVNEAGTVAKMYGQIDSSVLAATQALLNGYPDLKKIILVYVP